MHSPDVEEWGTLVKSIINDVVTYYPATYYIKTVSGADQKVQKYYSFGALTVAVRTVQNGADTLNWLLSDHLGSTSTTANADGTWNSEIRYTAFGEVRYSSGITPTDYRYTGQLSEAETGLYFYVSRWYDPALARFIQADTIVPGPGNPNAYDRYAYTLNNPINFTDPNGHISDKNPMIEGVCSVGACKNNPKLLEQTSHGSMTALWKETGEIDLNNPVINEYAREAFIYYSSEIGALEYAFDSQTISGDMLFAALAAEAYSNGNFPSRPWLPLVNVPSIWGQMLQDDMSDRVDIFNGPTYSNPVHPAENPIANLYDDPWQLFGSTPDDITHVIEWAENNGWRSELMRQGTHSGQGFILRQYTENGNMTGRFIEWHPGGSRWHGPEPYWKLSSSETGTIRIGPQFFDGLH